MKNLAIAFKDADADDNKFSVGDFQKELEIAAGIDIDLNDAAIWRFRSDNAWSDRSINQ